jgi:hypothetical protein
VSWRQPYEKQILLQIDLNQATYQSFLNCVNSFQGLETMSAMEQGTSVMMSKVSMERFIDNLGVLSGLTGYDGYDPDMSKDESFKYWQKIVKHLNDTGFFKRPRRVSHL